MGLTLEDVGIVLNVQRSTLGVHLSMSLFNCVRRAVNAVNMCVVRRFNGSCSSSRKQPLPTFRVALVLFLALSSFGPTHTRSPRYPPRICLSMSLT